MSQDSPIVWSARIAGAILAVACVVLGVFFFEGGPFGGLLSGWGWLLDGAFGGAAMGLGAGLGAASVAGEGRVFKRLRSRTAGAPALVGEVAPLTGQTESHLCSDTHAEVLGARVHRDVVAHFLRLREAAGRAGFDLEIDSGFRSFQRQLSIWNRKALGQLPVLDGDSIPLDIERLSEKELVFAILRWSALPGASRHHWGTDLDVFDAAARPEGYEVQLIPEEVNPGGMFGPFHEWLDQRILASDAQGFFRPYDRDRNGVAPERWHLSCAPVAAPFEGRLTVEVLRKTIQGSALELKEEVLEHLEEIFERFVMNVGRPPA